MSFIIFLNFYSSVIKSKTNSFRSLYFYHILRSCLKGNVTPNMTIACGEKFGNSLEIFVTRDKIPVKKVKVGTFLNLSFNRKEYVTDDICLCSFWGVRKLPNRGSRWDVHSARPFAPARNATKVRRLSDLLKRAPRQSQGSTPGPRCQSEETTPPPPSLHFSSQLR